MVNKNQIISAVGNFSTAYNLQIISVALLFMEYVYPENKTVFAQSESVTKTMALVGAILGQLSMGYVGDCLGRSRAMGLTMALTIAGAILSSTTAPYPSGDTYTGVGPYSIAPDGTAADKTHPQFIWLAFTRLILGIGVGGVYPLAATVAAESSTNDKTRGVMVSLVFSTQGLGFIACPLIGLLVIALNPSKMVRDPTFDYNQSSFNDSEPCVKYLGSKPDQMHCVDGANDLNWRIVLALGALPGVLLLPYKVSETSAVAKDPTKKSTFWADISKREHWSKLVGTAGGWFLFDIVFYGNTLFKGAVLKALYPDEQTIEVKLIHSTILFAIALPGYYVATILMERLGRKNIQLIGFFMMAVLYVTLSQLIGGSGSDIEKKSFVSGQTLLFIYGLTFFFANFGPNSTTFILPSETFPPEVRTSLNGFSAAMGKTGAAIGASMFLPLANSIGASYVVLICGIISLIGVLVTYFFVEDRRTKGMATSSSSMGYENINGESTNLLTTAGNNSSTNNIYE